MIKKQKSRSIKKIFFLILIIIIVLFAIYNVFWYQMVHQKYDDYSVDLERNADGFILEHLEPSYYFGDGKYEYTVAYPGYLSYTGNLAISKAKEDTALFIWPSFSGETKYGISLIEEGEEYQIIIDSNQKAEKQIDQAIVDKNKKEITELFQEAKKKWREI